MFKTIGSFYPEAITNVVFNLLSEVSIETNIKSYVVGGFVRDFFLRIPNDDIDIVVEGSGIEFAKAFSKKVNGKYYCFESNTHGFIKNIHTMKDDIYNIVKDFIEEN